MYIWKILDFFRWLFRFGKSVTPLIGSPKGQASGSASLQETEDFKLSPEVLAMGEYSQLVSSMNLLRSKAVVPPKKHINYPLMVLEEPSAERDLFFGILVAVAVLVLGSFIVMKFRKKGIKVNPVEQKAKDLLVLKQKAKDLLDRKPIKQEAKDLLDLKQKAKDLLDLKQKAKDLLDLKQKAKDLLDLKPIKQEAKDVKPIKQKAKDLLNPKPIKQEAKDLLGLKTIKQEAECQTELLLDEVPLAKEHPEQIKRFLLEYVLLSDEECMREPQVDN